MLFILMEVTQNLNRMERNLNVTITNEMIKANLSAAC